MKLQPLRRRPGFRPLGARAGKGPIRVKEVAMQTEHNNAFAACRGKLLICCGVAFMCYFASYMRLPVAPLYARSLGADASQVGAVNAAFFITAGLLSFPLGLVSDLWGRKRMAAAGLTIIAAATFLLCFSRTPLQMALIHLFLGIGLAALGPPTMSLVADISPPSHLGRSYGWYTTALYGGMSLGPAAGGFVAKAMGFPSTFFIAACIVLATLGMVVFFLPRPVHVRAAGGKSLSRAARELLHNRPLVACLAATLGGCFALGAFITFIPLHAQELGLDMGWIGFIFSAQGVSNALSRIPFGRLSDRVERREGLIVIGGVILSFSMAGFAIAREPTLFILFALTLGVGMGLAFTSIGALIAEVTAEEFRGFAMGGYNTCIYVGMMLSSAIMGPVIEKAGFPGGFLCSAVVNLFIIGVFYFLVMPQTAEAQA